ncbi:acyltransferase [Stutzerimonas decontaminans]|uniref:Acyltransferase n=2 Tax=Stutzerimonas TaxID=2901164 RepID=A0A023WUC7_STUST|nr:acyltransferase [Stutzerimonas decontaminans]
MTQQMTFRKDINGLRAWAVIAVILYHFGIAGFSGGFIGVDVFFVISGFLMTGIIVNGIEKSSKSDREKHFSIMDFYLSRAKRIIPALLAVCIATMIAGWFFLSPADYRTLSTHTISALGFFSNITFFSEAGYFDASSHEKFLLHTWSLSVEWQFYLIFPLFLVAVWKTKPGRTPLSIMITLGLAISLLLSIYASTKNPTAGFYLLPTRAWEMLAGALIYFIAPSINLSAQHKKALEAIGFILIITSIFIFDANSTWPSWKALIPVAGTVLVLIASRQHSFWTGNRAIQAVGDWSYSLYLWHWPFVVALVYMQLQDQAEAILVGITLTFLLSVFSYRLIEKPARTRLNQTSRLAGATTIIFAVASIMLTAQVVIINSGVPSRHTAQTNAIFEEANNKRPKREKCHVSGDSSSKGCSFDPDQIGAIVIGDSHAEAIISSVEKSTPDASIKVLDWTMSSCPTISGIKTVKPSSNICSKFISENIEKSILIPNSAPIVIINRTSTYIFGPNEPERKSEAGTPAFYISSPQYSVNKDFLNEMRKAIIDTACELSKTRQVYMVRPIPELKLNVPTTMGRSHIMGQPTRVSISLDEYHQRHNFVWKAQDMAASQCGVKILDPLPYLCREGRCWGDVDGLPLYYDDDHLSERGSSLLVPMFRQVFEDAREAKEATAGEKAMTDNGIAKSSGK